MSEPFVSWIASYPRSGNTWVRALLLAYQQGDNFNLNRMDGIPGEPPPSYYRGLWSGAGDYDLLDWAHMRPVALRNYYEHRRNNPFVLKTHTANAKINGVHLIPRGLTNRAVYVLRDPRDVLCSCAKYHSKTHEQMVELMLNAGHCLIDKGTGIWQFLSSYATHVRGWTSEKEFPVHVVRYGDLLERPAHELSKMLKFFAPDEEVNVGLVARAVEVCSIGNCRKTEADIGFRERPPQVDRFFGSATEGGWRAELAPEIADRLVGQLAAGKAA